MRRYTLLLTPEPEGGYTVTVPTLPGVVTYGRTVDEAKAMAREAIELHLEALREHGEPIPEETISPQTVTIDVAA